MTRTAFVLVAVLLPTVAAADPLPVEKRGVCPGGYASSASYCVPVQPSSPRAIVKSGSCPSGWTDNGTYCVEVQRPR